MKKLSITALVLTVLAAAWSPATVVTVGLDETWATVPCVDAACDPNAYDDCINDARDERDQCIADVLQEAGDRHYDCMVACWTYTPTANCTAICGAERAAFIDAGNWGCNIDYAGAQFICYEDHGCSGGGPAP